MSTQNSKTNFYFHEWFAEGYTNKMGHQWSLRVIKGHMCPLDVLHLPSHLSAYSSICHMPRNCFCICVLTVRVVCVCVFSVHVSVCGRRVGGRRVGGGAGGTSTLISTAKGS